MNNRRKIIIIATAAVLMLIYVIVLIAGVDKDALIYSGDSLELKVQDMGTNSIVVTLKGKSFNEYDIQATSSQTLTVLEEVGDEIVSEFEDTVQITEHKRTNTKVVYYINTVYNNDSNVCIALMQDGIRQKAAYLDLHPDDNLLFTSVNGYFDESPEYIKRVIADVFDAEERDIQDGLEYTILCSESGWYIADYEASIIENAYMRTDGNVDGMYRNVLTITAKGEGSSNLVIASLDGSKAITLCLDSVLTGAGDIFAEEYKLTLTDSWLEEAEVIEPKTEESFDIQGDWELYLNGVGPRPDGLAPWEVDLDPEELNSESDEVDNEKQNN